MKTSSSRNNAASSVMEVVVGAKGVSGLVVIKVGLVATLGVVVRALRVGHFGDKFGFGSDWGENRIPMSDFGFS